MKLEIGKFYRMRNGERVGPVGQPYDCTALDNGEPLLGANVVGSGVYKLWRMSNGCHYYNQAEYDIIAELKEESEMSENPFIKEVTKKELFEGYHALTNGLEIYIKPWSPSEVKIEIEPGDFRKGTLKQLVRILTEIAEAME